MTYLKCSHCGYLNPLTGQYQTFCQNCNKKLENNFSDWHKLHPDKSFDDFKALFGQTEEIALPQKRSHRKSKFFKKDANGKTKILWGALLGFVMMMVFITIGSQQATKIVKSFFHPQVSKSFLTKEWIESDYAKYGLKLSTPTKLQPYQLDIPQQVLALTDYFISVKNDEKDNIFIGATMAKYKIAGNLQAAANGSVNEMKNKSGVSNFNYTEEDIEVSGFPAIAQKGSYFVENNQEIKFKNTVILKNKRYYYQIIVVYPANDETGEKVANRVMQSVLISK